jgi:uncharacterized membrane protein YdfJ with MMPL/SSD domain
MDGIVLPLALALLAILLRSVRLLILPILCIAISALVTFMIMYGITFVFSIVSFAPSLMMSLLIAMSIDYSLFLLSRYREELLVGRKTREIVEVICDLSHLTCRSLLLLLAILFLCQELP